jgi:hypothetical protein
MQLQAYADERVLMDVALKASGLSYWTFPLWMQTAVLPQAVEPGTSTLTLATGNLDIQGGALACFWQDPFHCEVNQIVSNTGSTVVLSTPLTYGYSAGSRVMPGLVGRFTSQDSFNRVADMIATGGVQFTAEDGTDLTGSFGDLPTYQGFPVLITAPDEGSSASWKFNRLTYDFDPGVGKRDLIDTLGYGEFTAQYNFFSEGIDGYMTLRQFFYALAGQLSAIWVPTFAADFEVLNDIGASDTTIITRHNGYDVFANGSLPGRTNLMIECYDGNLYFTTCGASAKDGENIIVMIGPIGTNVAKADIKRISFLTLCRPDTDTQEITHHTDIRGVCTSPIVFRELPNVRAANDFGWDETNSVGGFVSDFGQTFYSIDPEETCFAVSKFGQTGGAYCVEIELVQPTGLYVKGVFVGVGLDTATFSDVISGSNGVYLRTDGSAWSLVGNGGSISNQTGLDNPGLVQIALNADAGEVWFRTLDLANNNPSSKPPWLGSTDLGNAPTSPGLPGSGVTIAGRAMGQALKLFVAVQYMTGVIAKANFGVDSFYLTCPAGFNQGWTAGD